jgi:hypothetical protein
MKKKTRILLLIIELAVAAAIAWGLHLLAQGWLG